MIFLPNKLNEIIGHDTNKILNWLERGKKKALLIHGPTGVGKTSCVYALAKEKDYEILELNSSNLRNREQIKNIIGTASQQQSLFFKKKLILVDEVDGISGRHDYGGLAELNKIIDNTKNKIILTANDVSDSKFNTLRRKCELLEFNRVNYLEIYNLLKKICDDKKIKYDENILKNLARKNDGDVRASLIDLYGNILNDEVNEDFDEREYKNEINEALRLIFKSKDVNVLRDSLLLVSLNPDEIFMWIDENLDKEYFNNDLIKAYEKLARADVFKGRIIRRQYYRLLAYQTIMMSVGVGLAKEDKKIGFVEYKRPERILKMWIAKNKNAKRRSISEKFSMKTHCSKKQAYQEFDLYSKFLKRKDIAEELELDDDEINWLEAKQWI